MKKDGNLKTITLLALIVAVIGLGVGFAAFTRTLTISSSATVTPNDDEFDIVVYGVDEAKADFDYMERYIRAIEKVVIADVVKYKDAMRMLLLKEH